MNDSNLVALDQQVTWHPFTQMSEWSPLVIDHGDGNWLVDTAGRRYLDGVSSLWCNVHGHRHPRLDAALKAQVDRLAHSTFLGLSHEPGVRLAAALVEVAPKGLTRVFYSDSGSTAVEIALKQSFQYWQLVDQSHMRGSEPGPGTSAGSAHVGGATGAGSGSAHVGGATGAASSGSAHVGGATAGGSGSAHVGGATAGGSGSAHVGGATAGGSGSAHVGGAAAGGSGSAHVGGATGAAGGPGSAHVGGGRPRSTKAKQKFLRVGDAYHGDTLGAVGVGGIDLFHRIFGPLLVQSIAIPSPAAVGLDASVAALERELSTRAYEIAAFVVEPLVQGAAGMLVHPPGFLARAAELCRRYHVHLIVDEVATGFGRTGTMFACEQEGVSPDFLCLAKGIAGGYLPLAATLSTEEIFTAFLGQRAEMKHFFHGHTFTANPLACAVGLESLALLREVTLANAQRQIPAMTAALGRVKGRAGVLAVRQCGLMAGIELAPIEGRALGVEVCERVRAHGVILRNLGDVVVWMPPLSIATDELAHLERATVAAIAETLG